MNRLPSRPRQAVSRVPRACGDEPIQKLPLDNGRQAFPAHAGMNRPIAMLGSNRGPAQEATPLHSPPHWSWLEQSVELQRRRLSAVEYCFDNVGSQQTEPQDAAEIGG